MHFVTDAAQSRHVRTGEQVVKVTKEKRPTAEVRV